MSQPINFQGLADVIEMAANAAELELECEFNDLEDQEFIEYAMSQDGYLKVA